MTVLKSCPRHGIYTPNKHGCPACYQADNRRRTVKQREQGRTTSRWKKLARQARQGASYRRQACGRLEERTPTGWLSVHLRPELGGNHRAATLDDASISISSRRHSSGSVPVYMQRVVRYRPSGNLPSLSNLTKEAFSRRILVFCPRSIKHPRADVRRHERAKQG